MNPRVSQAGKSRIIFLSKCEVRNREKTRFIKEREESGLLRLLNRLHFH